jgi:heme-degrading monooxygenase HmoA
MMTIVTDVQVRSGAEERWDAVMRERLTAAKERPGWVGGQLLRSESQPNRRVIVGTWQSRSDWESWHRDPRFAETRRELDALTDGPEEHGWHEVVAAERAD